MLSEYPDQSSAQASELILFDKFVQVYAEKLEHKAEMLSMYECVFESEEMMIVVLVQLTVKLRRCVSQELGLSIVEISYKIQHRDLHHTLVEVRRTILHHFHGNDLLCFEILALHNLSESALAKHIQNEIAVPKKTSVETLSVI